MLSDAYQLYRTLTEKYKEDEEWKSAKTILECIRLRDQGELGTGTADHSIMVAYIAYLIARKCIEKQAIVDRYFLAGILHDIGKLGMSDSILKSNSRLSEIDKYQLSLHVQNGFKILGELRFGEDILRFCLFHHERLDGQGYPNGMKKSEIPLIGRIAAVADVFGAMRLPRPYRPNVMAVSSIISSLAKEKGSYDPNIVEILRMINLEEECNNPSLLL